MVSLPCRGPKGKEEWDDVLYAVEQLGDLIDSAAKIVGRETIILIGFGQVSAVAMMYLLETNQTLCTFCCYKGHVPFENDVLSDDRPRDQSPKVRLEQLATWLRNKHWTPEQIRDAAGKPGVDRSVFLTHSVTFSDLDRVQSLDAYQHLTDLGFTAHMNVLYPEDRCPKKDAMDYFIFMIKYTKVGPCQKAAS